MTYEIISIIALLLCLLIIGIEYIFHYRLAEIQDDNIARLDGIRRRLKMRVEGVLFAPTDRCRADEITSLVKEIDGDNSVYQSLIADHEVKGNLFYDDLGFWEGKQAKKYNGGTSSSYWPSMAASFVGCCSHTPTAVECADTNRAQVATRATTTPVFRVFSAN